MEVVEVALLLQIAEDSLGILIRPIGQHDHVVAIVLNRISSARLDNEWRIVAGLLLKAAMAVVPVGAALRDWDSVLL